MGMYIEAVKNELLFHKTHTLNEKISETVAKSIPDETVKQIKENEPQQITFFDKQKVTNQQEKNLISQQNRTLIIRNGTKSKNNLDRAVVTSNNLKISSQMLGDEFQKRTDLLNQKLEKSLQNIQSKKDLNGQDRISPVGKKNNCILNTIYIGGGTPSILPVNAVPELLEFIGQNFNVSPQCEITVEANPDSFSLTKAIAWKSAGVNRISFGVQSDDDSVLKELGRVHNFAQFITALDSAKKAGFTNINADILLGLPNQTVENAVATVKNIADTGVTHISAYGLIVEDGTPIAEQVKSGAVKLPDDEQAVAIYNAVADTLKELGFARYEISNFAKIDRGSDSDFQNIFSTGKQSQLKTNTDLNKISGKKISESQLTKYQCKHNLNYWARGEFLGVGLSAYSFLNGEHWDNTLDLSEYLNQAYGRQNIEPETKASAMKETIMLALRCEKGLDIVKFNKTFGVNFENLYANQLKKLKENNLVKIENNHLKILDFEISNTIIINFF